MLLNHLSTAFLTLLSVKMSSTCSFDSAALKSKRMLSNSSARNRDKKKTNKKTKTASLLLWCFFFSSWTRTVNQIIYRHLQFGISIAIKCHEVAKTITLRLICKDYVAVPQLYRSIKTERFSQRVPLPERRN